MWGWMTRFVYSRNVLWLLFWVNLLGSVYGFYWYKNQLLQTPPHWLVFVPDSPTASLCFTLVLLSFLIGRSVPLLEAFAAVTLFKYGVWAISAIFAGAWLQVPSVQEMLLLHTVPAANWMLVFSHSGMALQALLFYPYYRFKVQHLFVVALWTLSNDFIDYVFDVHPWVHPSLESFIPQLGLFTLLLSLFSLILFAWLSSADQKSRSSVSFF